MSEAEEKILCESPTPGAPPVRIEKWKYMLVRQAILSAVPDKEPGLPSYELPFRVKQFLSREDIIALGSVARYANAVQLDLEAKGEIEVVPESKPHRLIRKV